MGRSPMTPHGTLEVREPATGRLLGEVRVHGPAQVAAAVAEARGAQADWGRRPFDERAAVILRVQQLLLDRAETLCEHVSRESGKTRNEALFLELLPLCDLLLCACARGGEVLQEKTQRPRLFPHKRTTLYRVARGVVGIIGNHPLPLGGPVGDAALSLLAGNAVVLKPSERAPIVAEKLRALFDEAGLPRGLFQVVHGTSETGNALIASGIDFLLFSGSTATGRLVAHEAAERLLPCALRLSGKDPALVLADADVKLAARRIAFGAFACAGQAAASIARCYVDQAVAAPFLEELLGQARRLVVGGPDDAGAHLGVVGTEEQLETALAQLADAVQRGATVLCGGEVTSGRMLQPTVVTKATHAMRLLREETRAPVLPVLVCANEAEAVRLANDSPFGLSASVFTRDGKRAARVARALEVGAVLHDDVLFAAAVAELPFAGLKESALGHAHGLQALEELTELRAFHHEPFALPQPWVFTRGERAFQNGLRAGRALLGRSLSQRLSALWPGWGKK